jgi:hypothetical protein
MLVPQPIASETGFLELLDELCELLPRSISCAHTVSGKENRRHSNPVIRSLFFTELLESRFAERDTENFNPTAWDAEKPKNVLSLRLRNPRMSGLNRFVQMTGGSGHTAPGLEICRFNIRYCEAGGKPMSSSGNLM